MTVSIKFDSLKQARRALDRLDKKIGLVWTQNKNCVYGNTITATIYTNYLENEEEIRENIINYTVDIYSNYYGSASMDELAKITAGKTGIVS